MTGNKKTIILIENTTALFKYNFSLLKDITGCRKVLIMPASQKNDSGKMSPYFDMTYFVEELQDYHHLDYKSIYAAVDEEIKNFSSDSEILLSTSLELANLFVGRLRDDFNLHGPGEAIIKMYRNKMLMKEALDTASIKVPQSTNFEIEKYLTDSKKYFEEITEGIPLPLILKPIEGVGGLNVKKIFSYEDFQLLKNDLEKSDTVYEIEEMIDGDLFHSDMVLSNDKIIFHECSKYLDLDLVYPLNNLTGSVALQDNDPLKQKTSAYTLEILKVLGQFSGAFHLEFFVDKNDNFVFLEVASRPAGCMIAKFYEKKYDVNICNLNFVVQGELIDKIPNISKKTECFWVFFPSTMNIPQAEIQVDKFGITSENEELLLEGFGKAYIIWNNDFSLLNEDIRRIKEWTALNLKTAW